jgi:hypothetical protein
MFEPVKHRQKMPKMYKNVKFQQEPWKFIGIFWGCHDIIDKCWLIAGLLVGSFESGHITRMMFTKPVEWDEMWVFFYGSSLRIEW